MSSRNFRKLYGNNTLPAPNSDDSDGEFDPTSKYNNQKLTYAGLEVSSDSESDKENPDKEPESDDTGTSPVRGGARKKKPQKKKGKGKKNRMGASTSAAGDGEELDEIDISLREVNALLGDPPPAPPPPPPPVERPVEETILEVKAKYLNVANEVKRLFGPECPEDVRLRNKAQPHRIRILKRVMISPTEETAIYDFKKTGLSMSIEHREGDVIFFVYNHDEDHQRRHHAFLLRYAKSYVTGGYPSMLNMDDARKYMHVEPLLEIADTLFRMDEHGLANEIVENVMAYLQYVAHPSFNLASSNVRLLYTYVENRPFHVVMLKYMYLLSNKACHRTALEIAKMLINIDPSDPLAVLFVIDTLALRAREHKWLIDAIDFFNIHRQAKMLFNIQYSYALAHFHVALKTKSDQTEADRHLQTAILSYPQVVIKILEYCNVKEPRIRNHSLFMIEPASVASEGLSELIMIYARLTWSRWREPQVMPWFIKNAIEVTENYNNSDEVKFQTRELMRLRHNIFQVWPAEILRHISIIKSMANLLMETTLNVSNQTTSGWDPLFDHGINRYNYRSPTDPPRNLSPDGQALLYRFAPQRESLTFLLGHMLSMRARAIHLGMDPWQSMLQYFRPRNELPLQDADDADSDDETQSNPEVIEPEEQPSDDDTPSDTDDPTSSPRRSHVFRIDELEALLNPYPMNNLLPPGPISTYPINFFNMFRDLVFDSGDSDVYDNEADFDDMQLNNPAPGSPSHDRGYSSDTT